MITTDEVKALPLDRKLQLMEVLWEDLRDRFLHAEVHPSHRDLLDQRRARVEEGTARVLDWDDVKGTIGRG